MRIITRKALVRRTFSRGVGTALGLPFLDAMIPALGAAKTKAEKRLGFVYVPNGVIQEQWTPALEGSDWGLTPTLKPLASIRNKYEHTKLPLLLCGGLGGTVKTGRHIRYADETQMTHLRLTVFNRAGSPAERLGYSTGKASL